MTTKIYTKYKILQKGGLHILKFPTGSRESRQKFDFLIGPFLPN